MGMASSSFTLITLFSLALVASMAEGRVAPGESNNWQVVAKDESLAETIEHFIHGESSSSSESLSGEKNDCHTSNSNSEQNQKDQAFLRDFEPRPNLSAYPEDTKLKGQTRTFMEDFEPRPQASSNSDEDDDAGLKAEKEFVKVFEPRPNFPLYQG